MFDENRFFYCYSPNLFRYLKMVKKLNYICTGLHDKTFKRFWQFDRTAELNKALDEYKDGRKDVIIYVDPDTVSAKDIEDSNNSEDE